MRLLIFSLLLLMLPFKALAHDTIWFNPDIDWRKLEKVQVQPATGKLGFKGADTYLIEKLNEKNKAIDFYLAKATPANDEQKQTEAPAGQLIWTIRENDTSKHTSPAKVVNVRLESWTEIEDGPYGDEHLIDFSWYVDHIIPSRTFYHNVLAADFVLYDADKRPVLMYSKKLQSYNHDERDMVRYLAGDLAEAIKKVKKAKTISTAIREVNIELPDKHTNNQVLVKSMEHALLEEAGNVKALRSKNGKSQYLVEVRIDKYDTEGYWQEPYVTTSTEQDWSTIRHYRDKDGQDHAYRVAHYSTKIEDHYGYYAYVGEAAGSFVLKDANTGEIIMRHYGRKANDKLMDAYREIARDFCKEAKKAIAKKQN